MSNIFVGVDFGQSQDHTAVAVLERTAEAVYNLRKLERLPLKTSYPKVVDYLRELVSRPQLQGCWLVADATGCGRPVIDLLRQANLPCRLVPVTITGGTSENYDQLEGWRVPKRNLVLQLVVALQQRRLVAPKDLPLAEVLVRELENFEGRLTLAGNETFGAKRERENDDCVLAASLAVWAGEAQQWFEPPRIEGPLVWNAAAFRR